MQHEIVRAKRIMLILGTTSQGNLGILGNILNGHADLGWSLIKNTKLVSLQMKNLKKDVMRCYQSSTIFGITFVLRFWAF